MITLVYAIEDQKQELHYSVVDDCTKVSSDEEAYDIIINDLSIRKNRSLYIIGSTNGGRIVNIGKRLKDGIGFCSSNGFVINEQYTNSKGWGLPKETVKTMDEYCLTTDLADKVKKLLYLTRNTRSIEQSQYIAECILNIIIDPLAGSMSDSNIVGNELVNAILEYNDRVINERKLLSVANKLGSKIDTTMTMTARIRGDYLAYAAYVLALSISNYEKLHYVSNAIEHLRDAAKPKYYLDMRERGCSAIDECFPMPEVMFLSIIDDRQAT